MIARVKNYPHLSASFISLICGIACAFALPPWHILPLYFAGFAAFYATLLHTKTWRQAFALGWLFALGYYLTGLSWIGNALLVDGNKFVWAWPLAVCALPAALAIFNALACALSARFFNLKALSGIFAFVAIFSIFEYLRGHLFTGFPWNLHGMIWAETLPILQILTIGNIYLLSLITVALGASLGLLLYQQNRLHAVIVGGAILCFVLIFLWGQQQLKRETESEGQPITIKIVQPNIAQNEKWDREKMRDHFESLLHQSRSKGQEENISLIIWPETATSYGFLNNETARTMIADMLQGYEKDAFLILGALLKNETGSGITNSIITIDKNGGILNRYNKSHLVPFGEYIPFHNWIPIETVTRFSGFNRGDGPTTLKLPDGLSYSPLVCYEIIFPGKVIAEGASPDFIINVTNDGWYGDSAGPYQHFAMARMRALEEGTPVIRSANTGISGLIQPDGRIKIKSRLLEKTTLEIQYTQHMPNTDLTSKHKGTLFFMVNGLLLLIALLLHQHSQKVHKK